MSLTQCISAPSDAEWIRLWRSGYCPNLFYSIIYSNPGVIVNPEGLNKVREYFSEVFKRYLSNNKITSPGEVGYNQFQEVLYDTCFSLPGSCDTALNDLCSSYSRQEIEDSPVLTRFCGCYAPELTGTVREYLLTPRLTYNRPCDPLCSRVDTIKLISTTGEQDLCKGDVCVIGNVNVNIENSSTPFVNFTQVCPCKENCRCIFTSNNLNSLISKLGLNYTINSYCGKGAICLQQEGNVSKVVECPTTPVQLSFSINKSFYIILIVIVIVFIFFGFIYYYARK